MGVNRELIAFVLNTREHVRHDADGNVTFRGPRNVVSVVTPAHAARLVQKEPVSGNPSGYFLLGVEMGSDNRGPNVGAETKRLAEVQGWINKGESVKEVQARLNHREGAEVRGTESGDPSTEGGVESGDLDAEGKRPSGPSLKKNRR